MVRYRVFRPHLINISLLDLMLHVLSFKKAAQRAVFLFYFVSVSWGFYSHPLSSSPSFADALPSVERLEVFTSQGSSIIEVEVAKTPEEQATGLMFRKELSAHKGMLFIYKSSKEVSMWMRNTYIPLDMIFIRHDGVVHRIEKETEPLSEEIISSKGPVSAVLELPSGTADRLGLKAGDRVQHPFFKTK